MCVMAACVCVCVVVGVCGTAALNPGLFSLASLHTKETGGESVSSVFYFINEDTLFS